MTICRIGARNMLEEIIWHKNAEVEYSRMNLPDKNLFEVLENISPPRNFVKAIVDNYKLTNSVGLIAEIKKSSPSKGLLCPSFEPVKIARAYENGGATCLSILADKKFFQGDYQYIRDVRCAGISCPILCKEFIINSYQILKARAYGSDCILLIAAVLSDLEIAEFSKYAHSLGLQCLIEVHTVLELERVISLNLSPKSNLLGINNRNLQTFSVDITNNKKLLESPIGQEALACGFHFVGESGIFTPNDVKFVKDAGCKAILVGESLITKPNIEDAVRNLLLDKN